MAIAFDAFSGVSATTSTSLTFSHTTSGLDRILFVMGHDQSAATTAITGITYGGVAMTQVNGVRCPGDRFMTLWYLINPATGTNDVVVTASASVVLRFSAISYTGAEQTGQPDGSDTSTTAVGLSIATDITTTDDNCWMLMFIKDDQGALTYTSTTSDTNRLNADAGGQAIFDTGSAITPAGAHNMTATVLSVANIGALAVSFSPSASAAVVTQQNTLLLMGVG